MSNPVARATAIILCVIVIAGGPHAAGAQDQPPAQTAPEAQPPAPPRGTPAYDGKLLRLAEILGSLQYLRTLCGRPDESIWRESMEELLQRETAAEPERRARLTAGYNHGYRTFASVYTACSEAAIAVEARYRREGESLTSEIVARYGN